MNKLAPQKHTHNFARDLLFIIGPTIETWARPCNRVLRGEDVDCF
jgi:hypothetical protein